MLVHLGLSWFYPPYSYYIGIFFPLLFFISGAVSYTSFKKHKNITIHLKKRAIETLVPYYVFSVLVVTLGFTLGHNYISSTDSILRWLLVSPNLSQVEIPIGQIWFIKTLIIIHLVSSFVFKLADYFKQAVMAAFLISLFAVIGNDITQFKDRLFENQLIQLLGPDALWNSIALLSCYLAGSLFYSAGFSLRQHRLATCLAFSMLAVVGLYLTGFNSDFNFHFMQKNLFYVATAISVTTALFVVQKPLFHLIKHMKPIEKLLLFSNAHSYALFLLHTVILFYVERVMSWQDLSGNYGLAIARMLLVITLSLCVAPYFSRLTKAITKKLLQEHAVLRKKTNRTL
ncbi:Acyltransferase family protein [Alkalimonas amylolytica]|uniref:Acyltransferase family protein n=2 Tax=Alkalimonas amylolytica TaxID=152573 RepID=A0A1H4CCF7_ALKAM|nr:Acyltransferase family protein [Alkalimonas amylolytica]